MQHGQQVLQRAEGEIRGEDQYQDEQLDVFEALLHIPDQVFYSMLVHGAEISPEVNGPIFQDIFQFAKDPFGSP